MSEFTVNSGPVTITLPQAPSNRKPVKIKLSPHQNCLRLVIVNGIALHPGQILEARSKMVIINQEPYYFWRIFIDGKEVN